MLNVTNATSNYVLTGAYYPCASVLGDTVWNISATQVGSFKIYDATISNATLKLISKVNQTDANTTVWSGLVSSSIEYSPFNATALIEFNTTNGVRNVHVNAGFRSKAVDVDLLVEYDRSSVACEKPSPITSINTSRLLGPGEFGSATVSIHGIGSSNLTLIGSARHDYCADIWMINGVTSSIFPTIHLHYLQGLLLILGRFTI